MNDACIGESLDDAHTIEAFRLHSDLEAVVVCLDGGLVMVQASMQACQIEEGFGSGFVVEAQNCRTHSKTVSVALEGRAVVLHGTK